MNIYDISLLSRLSYNIDSSVDKYNPTTIDEKRIFTYVKNKIIYVRTIECEVEFILLVSKNNDTLYIVIQGTDDVYDWAEKININQKTARMGIKFHNGFYNQAILMFNKIAQRLEAFQTVIIIGHSTGGAIGSILGYLLKDKNIVNNIAIFTIASPMFCNSIGEQWYKNRVQYYRIINSQDTIPQISEPDYVHVNKNIFYFKNDRVFYEIQKQNIDIYLFKRACCNKISWNEHAIEKYVELIGNIRCKFVRN